MKSLAVVTIALLTSFAPITSRPVYADESATIDEVMSCLRIAVGSSRGAKVREVEVERERGRRVCEVSLVTANGNKLKIYVEIGTGQIIKRERDD